MHVRAFVLKARALSRPQQERPTTLMPVACATSPKPQRTSTPPQVSTSSEMKPSRLPVPYSMANLVPFACRGHHGRGMDVCAVVHCAGFKTPLPLPLPPATRLPQNSNHSCRTLPCSWQRRTFSGTLITIHFFRHHSTPSKLPSSPSQPHLVCRALGSVVLAVQAARQIEQPTLGRRDPEV